jgi:threonine/homoserine/homoserine lactone efflux protein
MPHMGVVVAGPRERYGDLAEEGKWRGQWQRSVRMAGDLDLAWLGATFAFAVSMSASPGPNNAMVAASGATWGFRRTIPHMLGISLGLAAMLLAVAFGAGEVLRANPWLRAVLRWVGAAYLLWLAWRIATADVGKTAPASHADTASRPLSFLQGAAFQWVNPKAWMVALGAIGAYITATGAGFLAQVTLLAGIVFLVTLLSVAFWTMVGVGAGMVLRTRRALRMFNVVMAALLVASLVPLLLGQ